MEKELKESGLIFISIKLKTNSKTRTIASNARPYNEWFAKLMQYCFFKKIFIDDVLRLWLFLFYQWIKVLELS